MQMSILIQIEILEFIVLGIDSILGINNFFLN